MSRSCASSSAGCSSSGRQLEVPITHFGRGGPSCSGRAPWRPRRSSTRSSNLQTQRLDRQTAQVACGPLEAASDLGWQPPAAPSSTSNGVAHPARLPVDVNGSGAAVLRLAPLTVLEKGLPLTTRRVVNRQIKRCQTLPALRDLIAFHGDTFDGANTVHALQRIAKMARLYGQRNQVGGSLSGRLGPPLYSEQMRSAAHADYINPALLDLNELLLRHASSFEAWDVALALWSYATLDHYDDVLFRRLCQRGLEVIDTFKPVDIASIMTAFGRFKHSQPELLEGMTQIISKQLHKFKPAEVSNLVWGYARLRRSPGDALLGAVIANVRQHVDAYHCQELSIVLWALAKLGCRPPLEFLQDMEQAALLRLPFMGPQDIANTVWALAKMSYKAWQLLDEVPRHAAPLLWEFKPQELVNLLYGFARVRHLHRRLFDVVAPVLLSHHAMLNSQELALIAWAYGTLGYRPQMVPPSSPGQVPESAVVEGLGLPCSNGNGASSNGTLLLPDSGALSLAGVGQTPGSVNDTDFCDGLVTLVARQLRAFKPQGFALLVKAFAQMQYRPPPEFMFELAAAARRRMKDFSAHELSMLVYGLSRLQYCQPALYQDVVRQILTLLRNAHDEDSRATGRGRRRTRQRDITSIIYSCRLVGYLPGPLIDYADSLGSRHEQQAGWGPDRQPAARRQAQGPPQPTCHLPGISAPRLTPRPSPELQPLPEAASQALQAAPLQPPLQAPSVAGASRPRTFARPHQHQGKQQQQRQRGADGTTSSLKSALPGRQHPAPEEASACAGPALAADVRPGLTLGGHAGADLAGGAVTMSPSLRLANGDLSGCPDGMTQSPNRTVYRVFGGPLAGGTRPGGGQGAAQLSGRLVPALLVPPLLPPRQRAGW